MGDQDKAKVDKVVVEARQSIETPIIEAFRKELPLMAGKWEVLAQAMFIRFTALRAARCGI